MTRWIARAVAGAGLAAAFYALLIERARIRLDRFTVTIDKPGLPPDGLTILHLSDLHCRANGRMQGVKLTRLQRLLAGEHYDLLALTGDLIHNTDGLSAALAFIEPLHPRLGAFSCPGNRDYWESGFSAMFRRGPRADGQPRWINLIDAACEAWRFGGRVARNERASLHMVANDVPAMHRALAARGIEPLVNRAHHVRADSVDLWLAGVDDLTQGTPDLGAALADVPAGAPLLLLSHNPDIWLDPRVQQADLTLAGHTHGGQIRLPLVGALYTQGTHLTRHRPAGWFRRGTSRMFVSRGVGESFPLRFGARPQAALIRLVPGRDQVTVLLLELEAPGNVSARFRRLRSCDTE
ncbi:MAG: hypothetical protein CVU38_01580 [Chloroflexi bacterium HGW-Chloroflexi-1]|nr:MAG: hypothetical protein CVU38_01580 [Chloroflexi bacterium HGW-Chloroflexi-1]